MKNNFSSSHAKTVNKFSEDGQIIEITKGTMCLYFSKRYDNKPVSCPILVGKFVKNDIIILSVLPEDISESLVFVSYNECSYAKVNIDEWINNKSNKYSIERIAQYFSKIFQTLYHPYNDFFRKNHYLTTYNLSWVKRTLVTLDENIFPMCLPEYLPIHKDFPLVKAQNNENIDTISLNMIKKGVNDFSHLLNNVNKFILYRFIMLIPKIKKWENEKAIQSAAYDNSIYNYMHHQLQSFFDSDSQPYLMLQQSDLLLAMGCICESLGVKNYQFILNSSSLSDGITELEPTKHLHYICQKLGLSYRKITLEHNWYLHAGLPLIGSDRKPTQKIFPLIANVSGCYTKVINNKKIKIDASSEKTIERTAFAIYPSFPEKITMKSLLKLFLLNNKYNFYILMLGSFFVSILALSVPIITNRLISMAIPNAEILNFLILPGVLVIISLINFIFSLIESIFNVRYSTLGTINFTSAVMSRYLSLPLSYSKRQMSGEISQKLFGIFALTSLFSGENIILLLRGLFTIFSLLLMFYYSSFLAGIALAGALLYGFFIIILGIKGINLYKEVFVDKGKINTLSIALIQGINKIKLAGKEKNALAKWIEIYIRINKKNYRASRLFGTANIITQSVDFLVILILMLFIGLFFNNTLSVSIYIAFNIAFMQFWWGVRVLSSLFLSTLKAIIISKKSWDIIETDPESKNGFVLDRITGLVKLTNVSFYYHEGTCILKDININIPSKSSLAIVGPSGSGKSTLIKIMLGFLSPKSGSVTYDGVDLSMLDTTALRKHFGVVLQDISLQAGTIKEIITAGSDVSDFFIYQTLEKVGLLADVTALPMGLNTLVSETASAFSYGQRQRILLARTLIKKPRIIFLDEATSALDNISQKRIKQSIDSLACTRIIIAHRISTIQDCDHIIYLDNHILEEGSFRELMGKKKQFYKMANRQML